MKFRGYTLDRFQTEAIGHIQDGKSVIVAAPTGAGKTLVAEYAVDRVLADGGQIIYTAPIKALSNQKYRDFCRQYPGRVGIVTGDVVVDSGAPVVIMTTEIFRNMIFDDPARLAAVDVVVFDEIHYLDNIERGTVWEEAIIFAPQHIRFVCLSATIPNLRELAAWMNTVRGNPVEVVFCKDRPVPLEHRFVINGRIVDELKGGRGSPRGRKALSLSKERRPTDPLLERIRDQGDLPCLYFAFGRARCERLAKRHRGLKLVDGQERRQILDLCDRLALQYGIEATTQYGTMRKLVSQGVAYHHAGMLPSMKAVVEQLFTSRLLKLIFTTETFALGINMPARTVVFDDLTKFDGVGFSPMLTREYYQMAGRAGRRGMDKSGLVYSKVNPRFIRQHEVASIVYGKPEPVVSQFNSCYATVLNLYDQLGEGLYDTYPKSFHAFRSGKRKQRRALDQLRLKVKLLGELGYIDAEGLTDKGRCAAKLYGHELVATELIFSGLLDELPPTSLAVLLMATLYESREPNRLTPGDREAAQHLMEPARGPLTHVQDTEERLALEDVTPDYNFGLSGVTAVWAQGAEFDHLLTMTDTQEGHLVRDFRRLVLLMRQMLGVCRGRELLCAHLAEGIRSINRDVVDAERQLRADGHLEGESLPGDGPQAPE